MAFESLSEKFQKIFSGLKGKGKLTEADVKAAMREVRMALLEADVSFKVVKQFVAAVQDPALLEEVGVLQKKVMLSMPGLPASMTDKMNAPDFSPTFGSEILSWY